MKTTDTPGQSPTVNTPTLSDAADHDQPPVLVVLEDGRTFHGLSFGHTGESFGEAVFATGMTGYQEMLTDPSYRGQVLIFTAPQIGNTGINDEDDESARVWVAGMIVRDYNRVPSNWRSTRGLHEALVEQKIPGVHGVDTRALTRHLREHGAMRIGISTTESDPAALLERVRQHPVMLGQDFVADVSTSQPYTINAKVPDGADPRGTVVALDLGLKAATPAAMARRGLSVHVVPAATTIEQVLAYEPDGFFLSNGPGDPATANAPLRLLQQVLAKRIPVFGICFGHQILGRALGLDTYKLPYGHRGINTPVMDRSTGRVEITAHNHGFALEAPNEGPFDTPYGRAEVSHICLNDGVVEGLRCLDVPAFSVQYHPEAAAGPHDADPHFDEFARLIDAYRHRG